MRSTPWYIHVPFCEKICHYCDFSVLKAPQRLHQQWFDAIKNEVAHKISEFPQSKKVKTLYIGGGTPSILSIQMLSEVLGFLAETLDLSEVQEITLEANPEHLTKENIEAWKSIGINRFSVGIQSFDSEMLKTLGRNHSSLQAKKGLEALANSGISYSGDLMFCLPNQSTQAFLKDLEELNKFNPGHVSFYGLTIEEGTLFNQRHNKGIISQPDDLYKEMYLKGVSFLNSVGIERYELSNFAKPGFESIHNSSYWTHENYIGVGPGSHSFFKDQRFWNSKHFKKWVEQEGGIEDFEVLDNETLKFEKIWLGLRRREGINQDQVPRPIAKAWKNNKWVSIADSKIKLIGDGWLYLDEMVTDL